MFALLVAMLLSGEPSAKCASDTECTLVTGCECACCPAPSKAMTLEQAKVVKERCAKVGDCGLAGCPDVVCTTEAPGSSRAVCKAGACVKEPVPGAECASNSDCTMAHDCTCDCCPAPFEAMPRKKAEALRQKCARLGPCGKDPQECAGVTCTKRSGGDAVCREGKCVRGGR
ncbi:MAG: hypothetical protein QM817_36505 [Archangium sp.]